MTRKCAWCGESLGLIDPVNERSITHGIYRGCSDAMLRAAGLEPPDAGPDSNPVPPPAMSSPEGGKASE